MEKKSFSVEVDGKTISFETGKIAKQANGSVLVRSGETLVFCAAVAAKTVGTTDFFPLRVDYQENFSSAGKTVGGFIKRQGKSTQKEILVSRLIDRPIRPMFPEGYYNEVQLLSYVWSYDGVVAPEPLAICAASAALSISDIPLLKPIAGVRVGFVGGRFVVNPTIAEMSESKLDLMIAGTEDAVLMIEGYADYLTEEEVLKAIETGHAAIKIIAQGIKKWQEEIGKPKVLDQLITIPQETINAVNSLGRDKLRKALRINKKQEREIALGAIKADTLAALCTELNDNSEDPLHDPVYVEKAHKMLESEMMREMILEESVRSDGRSPFDIRPIDIELSFLPRAHGSGIFTRGETQALAVCTLGGDSMAQRFESLEGEDSEKFYLQYFFPPFSVGETGRMGPPGRREVGHGKLAERSLMPTLPSKEEFPYVIRLESNITESNGSSSMASVCGGCLAMMDAGVPIKRPVAGIAMGLILEKDKYVVLSDILGIEDALGDMDFKVSGDKEGITAFQMDIKVEGISIEIMKTALSQAKKGRIHILEIMLSACPSHKAMSRHAPRIETIKIKPSKIGEVIGPGGKKIREIIEKTGVEINISDDGLVSIASPDLASIEKAKEFILGLTSEVEVGRIYAGRVTSVVPFGVFVEILPGKEGLCHISEFDVMRIKSMEEVVKEGDNIRVKVIDINERGQVKLSRKATLPQTPTAAPAA